MLQFQRMRATRSETDNAFISLLQQQEQYFKSITKSVDMYKYQNNINQNLIDIACIRNNSMSTSESIENKMITNNEDSSLGQTIEMEQNFQEMAVNLKFLRCNVSMVDSVTYTKCRGNITKMAILNKVLHCPWKPRLPNNYIPFGRKPHDLQPQKENVVIQQKQLLNDKNNNFHATICDVISNEKNPTENAHLNHKLIKRLKCSICKQVFSDTYVFDAHVKRHTICRYTCPECNKSFSQLRNYKYHMSVHRGTKEFATTCPVCGKYFNDKGYLSSHMKIHRNRKEYKCSLCPKSFNQRVAYNMHVRIHTGVKPHVCEECGKAFSRKMLLKQHLRTHSGERPYACAHCDKRFADRSNMTLHLRLHTGVKPFKCSLCPKSFTKKHHLKSHLNFHTGAKPYSCPYCKLGFTQSSNMRTHMKKCNTLQHI